MKVLLVVTALMALASVDCAVQEDKFEAWKKKFGKVYTSKEKESQCRAKWLENQKLVLEHNRLADQGNLSYRLGMTDFADMSLKEYKNLTLKDWLPFNHTRKHNATKFLQQTRGAPLPDTVDWRNEGYVTEVEYQSYCGSCWAFSAAGALEGQIFRTTGKLVPLSKQQLVDCSRSFGTKGCEGGWMNQAFEYVKQNGLKTEKSYPYNGMDGNCTFDPAAVAAICTGYVDITYEDENALRETVATIGPVSVAIDADQQSFQLYNSGVYDEPACESMRLTHAVLIVGYGTENGKDYWLVKNSWGVGWGDKGYIKMSRNKKNQCGIASFASYPLVPSKTQSNVAQCETCSNTFVLGFFLFCMFY